MRTALIAFMILLLALPAHAQRTGGGKKNGSKADQSQSSEQKEKQRAADQAYKNALKSIPDKAPPADPWKGVRQ
jgi:hypothetical protein